MEREQVDLVNSMPWLMAIRESGHRCGRHRCQSLRNAVCSDLPGNYWWMSPFCEGLAHSWWCPKSKLMTSNPIPRACH